MNTFHTPITREANRLTQKEHAAMIEQVLAEVGEMLAYKGQDYDNLRTFVERMVFGDFSWSTLLFIKADRLCSTLMPAEVNQEKVDDCLIDLIVYAVAYRAWRKLVMGNPTTVTPPTTSTPTPTPVLNNSLLRPVIPRTQPLEPIQEKEVKIPLGTPIGEIAAQSLIQTSRPITAQKD